MDLIYFLNVQKSADPQTLRPQTKVELIAQSLQFDNTTAMYQNITILYRQLLTLHGQNPAIKDDDYPMYL